MEKKVFIAGCFDGPGGAHIGHEFILQECQKLGEVFIGLNDDDYIRVKKKREPLANLATRYNKIISLGFDKIFSFHDSPLELILNIKPDYIVVGNDYDINQVVGAKEIKEWGGEVKIITRIPNISTSNIIKRNSFSPDEIIILSKLGVKFQENIIQSARKLKKQRKFLLFHGITVDLDKVKKRQHSPLISKNERKVLNNLISRQSEC